MVVIGSMNAIWDRSLPSFPSLEGERQTDVLIIGGGMAGMLCAYFLGQSGVDYRLLEADVIAGGITRHTTAKITSQHGLIYQKLVRKHGAQKAKLYLDANQAAVRQYRTLCEGLGCDFVEQDAYVYSRDDPAKLQREIDALEKIGVMAKVTRELPLPFPVAGAVKFPKQAQFHPLKFLAALTPGLNIYEHSPVLELVGHTAITSRGKITGKKIIVATHFPFLNTHGSYFMKLYQHRSYVLALEPGPDLDGMYVDESETGLSFRRYQNLLLLGGGAHRTGKQGGNWAELERFAQAHYLHATVKARWATQDCMTLDHIPYIGPYSKNTPDWYVATGFNKWGMTSSMVAATLLRDLILGVPNPYAPVFDPSRSMLHPQLAINAAAAVANLLTFSTKRCPHMGCALQWNPQEHSWDCPCHGSRFTEQGKLIDNPATGHLKYYTHSHHRP